MAAYTEAMKEQNRCVLQVWLARNDVLQGSLVSSSFFTFVVDMIMEIAPSLCEDGDISICKNKKLFGLEYVVVMSLMELQVLLDRQNHSVGLPTMRFAS